MDKMGILRVTGQGNVAINDTWFFLKSIDLLYKSLRVFERFEKGEVELVMTQLDGSRIVSDLDFFKEADKVDPLILASVEIHSPGFWEFLGSLNPLEQIRRYLQDRHERIKDNAYRNRQEEVRLQLENLNKAVDISGKLKLLRERGVSVSEAQRTVDNHIITLTEELSKAQDKKLIEGAKLRPSKKQNPRTKE